MDGKFELFDHINNLTNNKVGYDTENDPQVKSYSPYMINRFISMSKFHIFDVNKVNSMNLVLPNEQHYNYYLNLLPKRKTYFKYIKKSKDNQKHEIDCLCNYFEIGQREASEYLNILTESQVKEIVNKYK